MFNRIFENLEKGKKVHFISGIDTNIGKTYMTAALAKILESQGKRVITQKMIQTGCSGIAEDILKHRELMSEELKEDDYNLTTSPIVLSYPASPHLALKIDGVELDLSIIDRSTAILEQKYDIVLQEGAGGLMVPLTSSGLLIIDYLAERKLPVILVTSGRLGSINHTLLSLYACRGYGVDVELIIYNNYPATDDLIESETLKYLIENSGVPVMQI